jgi:hypothetical protein
MRREEIEYDRLGRSCRRREDARSPIRKRERIPSRKDEAKPQDRSAEERQQRH